MTTSLTQRPSSRRGLTATVLLTITAACWAYLFFLRAEMGDLSAMADMSAMNVTQSGRARFAMPMTSAWTTGDIVLMWTMWAVMMAAMMIPSATPMIHAYDTTVRSHLGFQGSIPLFVAGYLGIWGGFAAVATATQWWLHDAALVDAMGVATSRWIAGPVLFAAGVYQFSGVKDACLRTCRTPLGFLLNEWRSGRRGALVMGLHHGMLCIGCCWALMALLFVLGVMNLWWIAAVATVVLIEKATRNAALPRILGVALIAWGAVVSAGLVDMGAAS